MKQGRDAWSEWIEIAIGTNRPLESSLADINDIYIYTYNIHQCYDIGEINGYRLYRNVYMYIPMCTL